MFPETPQKYIKWSLIVYHNRAPSSTATDHDLLTGALQWPFEWKGIGLKQTNNTASSDQRLSAVLPLLFLIQWLNDWTQRGWKQERTAARGLTSLFSYLQCWKTWRRAMHVALMSRWAPLELTAGCVEAPSLAHHSVFTSSCEPCILMFPRSLWAALWS